METEPTDLIPAYQAARLIFSKARQLSRWASQGLLREYKRPGFKARFYSRAEVLKFKPKQVRA